jgi:hypothetical protein
MKRLEELYAYIQKHFFYNPETGLITRNDRKNSNGSYDKDGYLIIKIKSRQIKAHRLAWFLYYGKFPQKELDHINRIRTDNRISNLREVSRTENVHNITKHKNKDTNQYGIYLDQSTKGLLAKYTFTFKNKTYRFRSLEEAIKRKEELCCA